MTSPVKRRVLAPLDANAAVLSPLLAKNSLSSNKPLLREVGAAPLPSLAGTGETPRTLAPAPAPAPEQPRLIAQKRPLPQDSLEDKSQTTDCTPKKACIDIRAPASEPCSTASISAPASATRRRYSMSPTPSSVFDNSGIVDTSQATNLTEPDLETARPVVGSHALTREQSRRRAEILKLRLSLARYKLRTGQVGVPLEQLRVVLPVSHPTQSQSHNSQLSPRQPQNQPRTLLPTSLKQAQVSCREHPQLQPQPQLPQRQWTSSGSGRGPANGIGTTAAYSDSSSDEDEFIDLRGREVTRPTSSETLVPRHQISSQLVDFDNINRIEDSDGQEEPGDDSGDKDEDADYEKEKEAEAKANAGEEVGKAGGDGAPALPQLPQPQSALDEDTPQK